MFTQSVKDEAAALMAVASDLRHPEWQSAIDKICNIERSLTQEARDEFYQFLSDHDASNGSNQ